MKKVCILTSVHSVTDTRIFIKQAHSLKKSGYNITLIAPNNKNKINSEIKIISLKNPKNRFERICITTFQLYKKALKADAEIYHFHDPELIPIGLMLKFKGYKVIYDVHEDVPKQILSKDWIWKPFRRIVSKGIRFIEGLADKYLDAIVSATPSIDEKFKNKNSITVQNFPLLSELVENSNTNSELNHNYITYIGDITSIRGIKEMIKAIELVPDKYNLKLLLGGKFSSEKLENEVRKLPGWEKVDFLGWITRAKMVDVLSKSKLGLVLFQPAPNHTDSQPNKMFEYMSASLPVLASDFALWKEVIEGNDCGINVDPTDPEQIARKIEYILDHLEERKRMRKNARNAVEEKYNWSVEEEKLLKLYSKLSTN